MKTRRFRKRRVSFALGIYRAKTKGDNSFFDIIMRWEFFVLFLDDDDVGATWESDNLFYFS